MSKIVFYCHDSLENIHSMEYYRQDINALKSLGHDVVICNRYKDIPFHFDMMYVWWWTYALYPVLLSRLLRRPSLITGVYNFRFENKSHGSDYFSRPWYQRLLIWLATICTDANLFISEYEFKEIPKYFNLKRAYYFPCAVGNDYFQEDQIDKPRVGLLNIAWSGKDNLKRKGVWDLLEALRILKDRGVSIPVTLAGKRGDSYPDLLQRIKDLGLEQNVKAVGEVTLEEKLALFRGCQLYLQPSYFEGFGLATAEAMASGCCVITCDVGEVRNVVGDCGLYVKPGHPVEIADAVQFLLSNPQKIDEFRLKAKNRMKDFFSFERKTAILKSVLQDIR